MQASGWWWYPLLLAAVGVAAYVVVKKTSGDDGAGAATAAAAAGLQGSRNSNQQGNARAASPSYVADAGTREVTCLRAGLTDSYLAHSLFRIDFHCMLLVMASL